MAMLRRWRSVELALGSSLGRKASLRAFPYSKRNVGEAGAPAVTVAAVRLLRALVWAVVSVSSIRFVRFRVTKSLMTAVFPPGSAYAVCGTVTGAATAAEAGAAGTAAGGGAAPAPAPVALVAPPV